MRVSRVNVIRFPKYTNVFGCRALTLIKQICNYFVESMDDSWVGVQGTVSELLYGFSHSPYETVLVLENR